jgi:hypothetical protein
MLFINNKIKDLLFRRNTIYADHCWPCGKIEQEIWIDDLDCILKKRSQTGLFSAWMQCDGKLFSSPWMRHRALCRISNIF